jgi:hypothetical protein
MEFGPVTFPAYADASAAVRSLSMTDEFIPVDREPVYRRALLRTLSEDPELRRAVGWPERMDAEDLGCLAQMVAMGAEYIADQDEADEQANIPKMEGILASLNELMTFEVSETEPLEPSEGEMADDLPEAPAEAPVGETPEARRNRERLTPLKRRRRDAGPFVPLPPRG